MDLEKIRGNRVSSKNIEAWVIRLRNKKQSENKGLRNIKAGGEQGLKCIKI